VALEPQLAGLDDASLLLLLDSYRIAGHPSARGLASAALPLVLRRAGGLSAQQLLKAARLFSRLTPQPSFLEGGGAGAGGREQAGGSESSSSSTGSGGGSGSSSSSTAAVTANGGGGDGSGASSSGGPSRPASVDDLMASISRAASARLAEFEGPGEPSSRLH
jgi:hypothetical protein